MKYDPNYDATIHTKVVKQMHNTKHTHFIDWDNYPFNDPEHTQNMYCSDDMKKQEVECLKSYLRQCEQYREQEVYASNYGGWPRIWNRVIGVGMASAWPYWKPRPTVLVESSLGGVEYYDWTSLTGVRVSANEAKGGDVE